MEPFELTVLGCGSAIPTIKHNPAAHALNFHNEVFLIDCGEGTQLQMRRAGIRFSRLNRIFISHLHGDHCFGLLGIITTLDLLCRTQPLHVYAPAALEPVLQQTLPIFSRGMGFEVQFHAVDTEKYALIYEGPDVEVFSIPLKHSIECSGFLFKEKPSLPHIRKDMLEHYQIPIDEINRIKQGGDYITSDGCRILHRELTVPARPPRSYAYCSDTSYTPEIAPYLHNVDLLYHEATFLEADMQRTLQTRHSTAQQAGMTARNSHAKRLLIGHFSSRYDDETALLAEAQSVFPNTLLAKEFLTVPI